MNTPSDSRHKLLRCYDGSAYIAVCVVPTGMGIGDLVVFRGQTYRLVGFSAAVHEYDGETPLPHTKGEEEHDDE